MASTTDETAPAATTATNELDALAPVPEQLTLSTGTKVKIVDLKVRQFFRLMRILTRGAGSFLMKAELSLDDPVERFISKIVGVLVVAIPEAEDETIDFVQSMVEPVGLQRANRRSTSREEAVANEALWDTLLDDLQNPDPDDLIDILEVVMQREAKDIIRLGKRLQRMFGHLQASGQLKALTDDAATASAETSTSSTQTSE